MYPYIETSFGRISSFALCCIVGTVSIYAVFHFILKTANNRAEEESFIFPRVTLSGIVGLCFAGLFDSLLKIKERGSFVISGITFYGGLIGACLSFYIILKTTSKYTQYSVKQWFDISSFPLVVFHFFGRMGCFLGGCCYGKTTSGNFGIIFPDNEIDGIFHFGQKCYPTQLFEMAALLCIFIILLFIKNKFLIYIIGYSSSRFFIEFFRGDDRGTFMGPFSPSQVVSIFLLSSVLVYLFGKKIGLKGLVKNAK